MWWLSLATGAAFLCERIILASISMGSNLMVYV
ncbi:MAG: hypothetical protein ACI8SJ_001609, partial [Shewanella sp.]